MTKNVILCGLISLLILVAVLATHIIVSKSPLNQNGTHCTHLMLNITQGELRYTTGEGINTSCTIKAGEI